MKNNHYKTMAHFDNISPSPDHVLGVLKRFSKKPLPVKNRREPGPMRQNEELT